MQTGPVLSSQLSLNAGLVSEPQSKVEEDREGERRRGGRQRAHERGHSSIPEHQLSVSRGPGQETKGAAGDAAEVGALHSSSWILLLKREENNQISAGMLVQPCHFVLISKPKRVCCPQHQQDGRSERPVLPFLHPRDPPQLCHVRPGPVTGRHAER